MSEGGVEGLISKRVQRVEEPIGFYVDELPVLGDNIGASRFAELRKLTEAGRERGMMVYRRSKLSQWIDRGNKSDYEVGGISEGDESSISNPSKELYNLSKGKAICFVHTHPQTDEDKDKNIRMSLPSSTDLRFAMTIPSMVILDWSGLHLLSHIHNIEKLKSSPPDGLAQQLLDELPEEDKYTYKLQKILAERLRAFGLSYTYTENIVPNDEGLFIFKAPTGR